MIALATLVAAAFIGAKPGEVFPDYVIGEHCRALAASANPKVAYMAGACSRVESEYRDTARRSWSNAKFAHRTICETEASAAVGSYQVLASCLNDEFVKDVLLNSPKRRKH